MLCNAHYAVMALILYVKSGAKSVECTYFRGSVVAVSGAYKHALQQLNTAT